MIKKAIADKIMEYDVIIIHRHVRPDPDAFGSQVGLAKIISESFSNKEVYVVGDGDPGLTYLAEMDHIDDSKYNGALVIVCDTANQARISDQRYSKGKEIIKIDHHPNVDPYGDLSWVNTEASSTSEMIYEFYTEVKQEGFTCGASAARLLYGGIVGDTGRFLFPSTTEKTFRYSSELVTYGFDRTNLYESMYKTKQKIARLKGYILQNFEVSKTGVSSVKISKQTLEEFNMTPTETSSLVGVLGDIEGILAWVIFVEEDDLIRVRLRSKGPVINEIAANYNGGGHPLASGATIYSWDESESLVKDLEEACLMYNK